jgi:hypothetical protein
LASNGIREWHDPSSQRRVTVEQLGAELRDRLLPSIRIRSQRLLNRLVQTTRQARTGF